MPQNKTHTHRPWVATITPDGWYISQPPSDVREIAVAWVSIDEFAHLIAAAPDMLEDIKWLLRHVKPDCFVRDYADGMYEKIKAISQRVDKAEGK